MDIISDAKRVCAIYSASYNARYWYPFKLHSVGNGWDSLDNSCMDLMIDSNINDDSVTNAEIIEGAVEAGANKIIPKDYLGEPKRTRESLIEFEEIIETEYGGSIKPTIIPVLQDDHVAHLSEHESFYSEYSHIAVGGMIELEPEEQISRIKQVRDITGDTTHIHGFGMGCSLPLIKALRHNPSLLDSLDMSTAEKMVKNGQVSDWRFEQDEPDIPMPYGEDKTTVNAGFSKSVLVMLNYMLTDRVNEDRLEEMFYEEMGLGQLERVVAAAEGQDVGEVEWSEVDNNPREIATDSGQQSLSMM
jgi:hypothetical protein